MTPTPHSRRTVRRPDQGLTLVELMVTLAVMAILMAIAVPSFSRTLMNNTMASQTNELVGSLQLARSEAVRQGITVTLAATSDEGTFEQGWKVFPDSDGDGALATGDEALRSHADLPSGLAIRRVTASDGTYDEADAEGSNFLVFNARGGVTTTAFFRVCSATHTDIPGRIVQVTAIGKVAVIARDAACATSPR